MKTTRLVIPLVAVAVLAGAGCGKLHRARRAAAATPARAKFQPPALALPSLTAPQPLPAARVLHIFFTSNVVGDLEPCG